MEEDPECKGVTEMIGANMGDILSVRIFPEEGRATYENFQFEPMGPTVTFECVDPTSENYCTLKTEQE